MLGGGSAPKSASMLLLLLGPGAVKKRLKVQIWRQIVLCVNAEAGKVVWAGRRDK